MRFRNGVNEQENEAQSWASGIDFDPDEDKAVQADAQHANINAIVARFRSTGVPPAPKGAPVFGDFSEGFDLAEAFQVTRQAKELFAALGSEVRDRFANDPLRLAAFLQDPNNREEGVRLGLVREPDPVVTPDPATAGSSGGTSAG